MTRPACHGHVSFDLYLRSLIYGSAGFAQVLSRREQLGLRRDKKADNKAGKGKGKGRGNKGRGGSGLKRLKSQAGKAGKKRCSPPKHAVAEDWEQWAAWGETGWYWDHDYSQWVWDDAWQPDWDEDWGNEGGWEQPAKKAKKQQRSSSSKTPAEKNDEGNPTRKAKAKAGAKAKAVAKKPAAVKAKAKARGKAKPTAKEPATPKAKAKSRGRGSNASNSLFNAKTSELHVEKACEFVQAIEPSTDPEGLKDRVRERLPLLSVPVRLNVYWNRHACGLTLRYVDENDTRKQSDVAYFNYAEKTDLAMCCTVAAACLMVHSSAFHATEDAREQSAPKHPPSCKAVFMDEQEVVHPEDERITPAKEHFKEIGSIVLRKLS